MATRRRRGPVAEQVEIQITAEDIAAAEAEDRTDRPDTAEEPPVPEVGVMVFAVTGFSRFPGRHGKVRPGEVVEVDRDLADYLVKTGAAREIPR